MTREDMLHNMRQMVKAINDAPGKKRYDQMVKKRRDQFNENQKKNKTEKDENTS